MNYAALQRDELRGGSRSCYRSRRVIFSLSPQRGEGEETVFTGIIKEIGRVEQVQKTSSGISLVITTERASGDIKIGDSVAVNGCCLTVVEISGKQLSFDLLRETWER